MPRANDGVRVIVIAAAGKLFSAGHDLKEMTAHRTDADRGEAFFERTFALCSRLMQSIVEHPKPVIAEVDGIATAAGCQLVASCDLALASDRSRLRRQRHRRRPVLLDPGGRADPQRQRASARWKCC